MAKKAARQSVINLHPASRRGRVVLISRDGSRFPTQNEDTKLQATITESDSGSAIASSPGVSFKTQAGGRRLVISFSTQNAFTPHFVITSLTLGSGVLTDGFLSITLTDSTSPIAIASASEAGTTVTITTTTPHGFLDGCLVQVSGVAVAGYNGTFAISLTNANTFTYQASAGLAASNGTGTVSPGGLALPASTITAATEAATTVTITTSSPHGFAVGNQVVISGVLVDGYNGTFTIVAVPSTTIFTYTTAAGLAASNGGTAALAGNIIIQQDIPVEFVNDPNAP